MAPTRPSLVRRPTAGFGSGLGSGYETPMELPTTPMMSAPPGPQSQQSVFFADGGGGGGPAAPPPPGGGLRRARTDNNAHAHAQRRDFGMGSPPESLNGVVLRAVGRRKVGLRDRIGCFQWTWFTMTMATGGIANVLHSIPYKSQWLTGIGLAFFFLNLCLFVINCVLISLRFYWRPGSLAESFTDQLESLFISAIIVSMATILITITQYGIPHAGPWLISVVEALFWVYIGVSTLVSASLYLTLWSTQVFPIHTMTPVWVFPAYPLLLSAPFGGNLVSAANSTGRLDAVNAVPVTLAAVTAQGTGFLISFMICAAFLYRLMTQKLPRDHQRPGVFISIGPGAFTCAGLGSQTSAIFPPDSGFMPGTQHAAAILRLQAYMAGLWLWGLSIWFFLVSVGSLWKYLRPESKGKLRFQMTWFSFVFPNTALVTATEALGTAFDSPGLKIFGCVLAACLVLVWILVFTEMLRCLWRRELLWPKDED
ncbi:malic acid transport protein [Chaetomidium leptoderma]|uniref:Malic acid transport protein n=1 Tax=Chaetomidium leptoderma TaxID=669021 RepID=A0AAN6ZZ61_9PEZI|nr:malic acid transport protein [Chaetomidium leptoderma]